MNRALATIALLILSNTFMTLAWYGHIAFKSKIERFGMLSIILLSWGIALFEYCFQVPANRIGSSQLGGPFSIWELKVIQEVISLLVFTVFAVVFMKKEKDSSKRRTKTLFSVTKAAKTCPTKVYRRIIPSRTTELGKSLPVCGTIVHYPHPSNEYRINRSDRHGS